MNHAWCNDIARDAAVRAAEDGRTGPLPTLGEAISAVTECRSENTKGEEMSQGMRTERVVLEITYNKNTLPPTSRWAWKTLLRLRSQDGESVRVVELSERHAEFVSSATWQAETAEQQRDAAIRERDAAKARVAELEGCSWVPKAELESLQARVAELEAASGNSQAIIDGSQAASGGGEGEPVAWGVMSSADPPHRVGLHWDQELAERLARQKQCDYNSQLVVAPLYRAPPQPRGWLTEEERDLIAGITDDDEYTEEGQNIAKALLARSSPPEVVLPESWTLWIEQFVGPVVEPFLDDVLSKRDAEWRAALAAAGVALKEVGRE
jgi:hypothetical protein